MFDRSAIRRRVGLVSLVALAGVASSACVAQSASEEDEIVGQSADALRSTSTPGKAVWVKTYSSTTDTRTTADDVTSDENGSAYAALTLGSATDLGDGARAAGSVLAKYDGYGKLMWSRSLGDMPQSNQRVAAHAGRVAVGGSYTGPSGTSPQIGWLVVHDLDGNPLWTKRFQTSDPQDGNVWINGLAIGPDGSIVISGRQEGAVDFGGGVQGTATGRDGFLAAFSASGAFLWSRLYGGANYQTATGVAIDGAGMVYVTGVFTGAVNAGGATLSNTEPPSTYGSEDVFLAKLTAAGQHVWSKSFAGTKTQLSYRLAVTNGGRIALLGTYSGDVDFGCGKLVDANTNIYTEAREIFVAKLDTNGQCQWSRRFAGAGIRSAAGVAIDTYGDVTMAVGFGRRFYVDSHSYYSGTNGTMNMVLAKLHAVDGHTMFSKHYGSDGNTVSPTGVVVVPSGRIMSTGSFYGTVDFGRGPMTVYDSTAFVARFYQ